MKILLLTTLVAIAAADVSHLLNQQGHSGYQYQPQTSYGVPQASVLGNLDGSGSIQSGSYSNAGSVAAPELTLPSISGSSQQFNSGFSSGVPIGGASSFNGASSIGGASSFNEASSISGATIQTFDNGGFSTPVPLTQDALSSLQVSTSAPSVDFSNIQVSSPAPIGSVPSVNFVKYQEPSNSYQFLSKLSQPAASTAGFNTARFSSDAALNSGFGSGGQFNSGLGLGGTQFISQSSGSGGSISDSFGVATDAAGSAGIYGHASAEGHLEPEVSKHLYFFDAPEDDEEEVDAKISIPPVAPKKTYKIIFIKAPTYRNQGTITIPAQPPTEEKTLVYVLVKKPERNANVRFQTAAPIKPSKPEVFFIKYKTQKEAEEAVAEIQSKHGATGQVIANLPAGKTIDHIDIPSDIGVSSSPSGSFGGSNFGSSFGSSGQSGFSGASIDSVGFSSRSGVDDSALAQSENEQSNVNIGTSDQQPSSQGIAGNVLIGTSGQQPSFQGTAGNLHIGTSDQQPSFQGTVGNLHIGTSDQQPSFQGTAGNVNIGTSGILGADVSSQGEGLASSNAVLEGNSETNVHSVVSNQDSDASGNQDEDNKPEDSEKSEDSPNVIEQRFGGEESESEEQGSNVSGFKTYGPPFKAYGPPSA